MINRQVRVTLALTALSAAIAITKAEASHYEERFFKRVATFPIYQNLAVGEDATTETGAEIVAVSEDGRTLLYTDSEQGRLGFIDIRKPRKPLPAGFLQLDGEPTSVAVHGKYALVGVNTSEDFVSPSGKLVVVDISVITKPLVVREISLGGQPDSVAVSPNGTYAAIAIENERDEDLNDGFIPQLPAGYLSVVDLAGAPGSWTVSQVDLTGLAETAPDDPEPEYVSINNRDVAAVTLQENNHIVLVDLARKRVKRHWSAGSVTLNQVDSVEEDVIRPTETLYKRREPDAITWLGNGRVATANEGDYEDPTGEEGGSRSFTIFNTGGKVRYEAAQTLEHRILRIGHYPEHRSENKGNEPEAVAAGDFAGRRLLFVGAERANAVAVYKADNPDKPEFLQLLPTGVGPEGILPVPERNLLVVASEVDAASEGFRSTVSIYKYKASKAFYPQIASSDGDLNGWGGLSGLAADNVDKRTVYSVHDSVYGESKIFTVDVGQKPAMITDALALNKDGEPVSYDLEGIARRGDGGFWLVSEGNADTSENLLIRVDDLGAVQEEIALPDATAAKAVKFGFEGVAVSGEGDDETVLVAIQREWAGDPAGHVRIAIYTPADGSWAYYYYPLDSTVAGWVGLSEITALPGGGYMVIERDNQQGPAAAIKRLYRFDLPDAAPGAEGARFPVLLSKSLVRDLLPDLRRTNGWVVDKVEGAAVTSGGKTFVVTDNDGVDDATGETRFLRLRGLFED